MGPKTSHLFPTKSWASFAVEVDSVCTAIIMILNETKNEANPKTLNT